MASLCDNVCPRDVLEHELARRVARNPRYSLRSFARSLGVSHTMVSLVLSGKRPVSRKLVARMAEQGMPVAAVDTRGGGMERITMDTHALLSEWYHFALLSLLELPEARLDPRWIARRLGISPVEARLAVLRLKRLKMIAFRDGRWRQCTPPIKVENEFTTALTRRFQSQVLRKAEESMEHDPFERRDISSITFAMDPRFVAHARERIRRFRRELMQELEQLGEPSEVYHLAVQIYPVTRAASDLE